MRIFADFLADLAFQIWTEAQRALEDVPELYTALVEKGVCALHPTPYTLHPTPYTLAPTP
eukprot:981562-Rhodomonas_salina.1